jgi:hypothetical protein
MTHACPDGSDDRGAIHQNAAPSRTSNKLDTRGSADLRLYGAADQRAERRLDRDALLDRGCVAAKRDDHDVLADDRFSRSPVAEADPCGVPRQVSYSWEGLT